MTKAERKADAKQAYVALMKFYPFTLENLDGEQWRDIAGYEGRYQVSTMGRVKSLCKSKEMIIKPTLRKEYLRVSFLKKGDRKRLSYQIHRLVAQTFIPNPNNFPQVDHRFGMKFDNSVENLRWATASENTKAAYELGLIKNLEGEEHPNAKLTNAQVIQIRENWGVLSQEELAKKFGVSDATISLVQLGKVFKNVGGVIHAPRKCTPRLPDEIRDEIRRVFKPRHPQFNACALGRKYGVNHQTIMNIVNE